MTELEYHPPRGELSPEQLQLLAEVAADSASAAITLSPGGVRLTGLDDVDAVRARLRETGLEDGPPSPDDEHAPAEIGWIAHAESDGAVVTLGAGVADGILPTRTAEFLAAVGHPIVVTRRRTILVHGLDDWRAEQIVRVLAPLGLIFDADSPALDLND
ncbi:hypothetical protein DW322_14390 [Rhodococcus rhodnii]|uniref:Precorrin-3B synthase n=2 Tax=Rhodococcus rhodnii TaxID=38312 RepID=A0A6P2CHI9_9NOCA|nr:putative precorrin-3B synthase [Rhodococcus rhodnii]EOM78355.1 putative precorrin-3B synthase [Rhodococcus rhodnii LMG 5362]TXG91191.1 hypothetical protein DW322_14390 [Rhodococcus rhodnii]